MEHPSYLTAVSKRFSNEQWDIPSHVSFPHLSLSIIVVDDPISIGHYNYMAIKWRY